MVCSSLSNHTASAGGNERRVHGVCFGSLSGQFPGCCNRRAAANVNRIGFFKPHNKGPEPLRQLLFGHSTGSDSQHRASTASSGAFIAYPFRPMRLDCLRMPISEIPFFGDRITIRRTGGKIMRWIALTFWILLCFAVAIVSGSFTSGEIRTWYRTLARPSIAPPNWVFGPVWTLLYALMAIAAWRVSLAPSSPWRTAALTLFLTQLVLNFAWSLIFFRLHRIDWALLEVIVLWASILFTTVAFARVSSMAGWLMVPYIAWVSFAGVLNAAFWRLNK